MGAHGGECHLFGKHVLRRAAVFTRHGQTVLKRVAGNIHRAADIADIKTPQHDGHHDVILRAFALFQHATNPRQIERQQLALFRGFQLFTKDGF